MAERQRFCLDKARERLEEEFRLAEEDYNVEFRASDQDESLSEDEDNVWDSSQTLLTNQSLQKKIPRSIVSRFERRAPVAAKERRKTTHSAT